MEARDRVNDLLLAALKQALSVPGEHRLFKAGKLDGLFPGRTGASLDAAGHAVDHELLRRTRIEIKGKTEIEWVEITPRGVEFLHENESPLHALHELRDTLRANRDALPGWLAGMQQLLRDLEAHLQADSIRWDERLAAMEQRVDDTLRRLEAAGPLVPPEVLERHPWTVDALNYLDRRRSGGGPELCPLPELFAAVRTHYPALALAAFHDGLRRLHQRRAVALRPVDDPTAMTQPEFALLEGDCVFYLAAR
ncbi:MAG: hypothetical protein U0736_00535 [Gemmataceae bacterium]